MQKMRVDVVQLLRTDVTRIYPRLVVVVMLVMALAHIWQSVKVAIAMAGIHLLVPMLARRYACTTPKSYLISMLPNSGDFEASQVRRGALSLLFFVELRCADKTR